MFASLSIYIIVLFALAFLNPFLAAGSNTTSHPLYHRFRRQSSCSQLQYRCANGDCIPSYSVCDGSKECSDGSDETRAACTATKIRCPMLAFECAYGACIDREQKCDGKEDCADGSDEICTQPSTSCPERTFQCSNGECINQYSICDGVIDCTDRSDETRNLCKNLKCAASSFQCEYGACLEMSARCNNKQECHDGSDEAGCPTPKPMSTEQPLNPVNVGNSCILPQHPQNGFYVSSQCGAGDSRTACRNIPGTPVPDNWLLKYTCNANFDISSTESNEYSVCSKGEWKNPLDCIKLCPPLEAISMKIDCEYDGREVPCTKRMKPNTTASASCKQHYREIYLRQYSNLTCLENGDWSHRLFYCAPDCGISSTLTPLISNGDPAILGQFPWLASIFMKNETDQQWEQQCGGTLISPHIVLTAAHCLVDETTGSLRDPENMNVGLGKYYRDYYKLENYSAIVGVREIVVPRFYSGRAAFFALDIGLIDLKTSIQVTAYIMPACVDWQATITINTGTTGYVAGWGATQNEAPSPTVLTTNLTYLDNGECIRSVRNAFQKLVTHDKFCGKSVENGGQVASGDSGGGLTIVEKGLHFVYGVVSTKITQETAISLFTDLSNIEHRSWLEEQKNRFERLHIESS
ncbi:modular serine protease-like isoform X2 [Homalodisca vitripennis]|uniref:modular serine protease-like isoform X2 n=1 Tax=Homalodisca vitripennis TaxID=197043 RepID=UPI001EEB78F5|nr:modular serine protease-like isoform X2 [Homalodisca vitripennis]